jgi:hypothetical protein
VQHVEDVDDEVELALALADDLVDAVETGDDTTAHAAAAQWVADWRSKMPGLQLDLQRQRDQLVVQIRSKRPVAPARIAPPRATARQRESQRTTPQRESAATHSGSSSGDPPRRSDDPPSRVEEHPLGGSRLCHRAAWPNPRPTPLGALTWRVIWSGVLEERERLRLVRRGDLEVRAEIDRLDEERRQREQLPLCNRCGEPMKLDDRASDGKGGYRMLHRWCYSAKVAENRRRAA